MSPWLLITVCGVTLYALHQMLALTFSQIDRAHEGWRATHPSLREGKLPKERESSVFSLESSD